MNSTPERSTTNPSAVVSIAASSTRSSAGTAATSTSPLMATPEADGRSALTALNEIAGCSVTTAPQTLAVWGPFSYTPRRARPGSPPHEGAPRRCRWKAALLTLQPVRSERLACASPQDRFARLDKDGFDFYGTRTKKQNLFTWKWNGRRGRRGSQQPSERAGARAGAHRASGEQDVPPHVVVFLALLVWAQSHVVKRGEAARIGRGRLRAVLGWPEVHDEQPVARPCAGITISP